MPNVFRSPRLQVCSKWTHFIGSLHHQVKKRGRRYGIKMAVAIISHGAPESLTDPQRLQGFMLWWRMNLQSAHDFYDNNNEEGKSYGKILLKSVLIECEKRWQNGVTHLTKVKLEVQGCKGACYF